MSIRRRDIRTERQAREIAKRFGWGTPMPDDDAGPAPGDAWWDETPADQRTPVGPLDVQRPIATNT